MRSINLALIAVVLVTVAACASGPRYDMSHVATGLTPAQAASAPAAHSGAQVIWGGVIINTRNQPGYTDMEILAYPLDSAQRPDISRGEQGRFLVRHSSYLEGVDYAPGRLLTVKGQIEKVLEGKVGDAPYAFPLVQSDGVYLWPIEGRSSSSPRFHFGVGVIFGR